MDLFDTADRSKNEPLAYRMRPRNLDEYIGQDHIVGPGRLLRRAIQADRLSSVIFYGPPGTGKTTLARVIAGSTHSHFSTLNAVLSGVKELREEIEAAKKRLSLYGRRTILFVDEVHRWNRSQQDALLPWVENGTFILIGATTENPFFEVNAALVSRSRIFQLKPLTEEDLMKVARQALEDPERGYGRLNVVFEDGALEHLVHVASGDARSLLNALELAVVTSQRDPVHEQDGRSVSGVASGADVLDKSGKNPEDGLVKEDRAAKEAGEAEKSDLVERVYISREAAEESIQQKAVLYDKEGDYHFDVISAFIKSVRGSDPDAALYWLAKMVYAGEDPRFIFRRMLILACEDVGLGDPNAITVVEADAAAFDRIGMPEGRYHLTHACLYLSTAPKSNSAMGFFDALRLVQTEEKLSEVPNHLRDGSRDSEGFGHGQGYMYPHAYRDHWTAQQYLPSSLQGKVFYHPGNIGYERTVRAAVLKRREIQLESVNVESFPENLTFSPGGRSLDEWARRAERHVSEALGALREKVFALVDKSDKKSEKSGSVASGEAEENVVIGMSGEIEAVSPGGMRRADRVLVVNSGNGLFVWEALRRVPEGLVAAHVRTEAEKNFINHYASTLDDIARPLVVASLEEAGKIDKGIRFEWILARNPVFFKIDVKSLKKMLTKGGTLISAESVPSEGSRLSDFVSVGSARDLLLYAEKELYSQTRDDILDVYKASFSVDEVEAFTFTEERVPSGEDIEKWVRRSYIPRLALDDAEKETELVKSVTESLSGRVLSWKTCMILVKAKP